MNWKIESAVSTDAGKRRKGNEDNYYLFGSYKSDTSINAKKEIRTVSAEHALAAVYDGMGGEEAGEIASLMAAKYFSPCALENVKKEAVCQVEAANKAICEEMQKRGVNRMGTTAALLYLDSGRAICCNVGDSRCYFIRDGTLRQLSVDHSEAENLIRMGVLERSAARESKSWHKLTQHLGIFPEEFVIEPHFSEEIPLRDGDIFLLCSDGLTDMVMDEEIAAILGDAKTAEDVADQLVAAALEHGGKDNVTVMVLLIHGAEEMTEQKAQITLTKSNWKLWCLIAVLAVILIAAVLLYNARNGMASDNKNSETDISTEESSETNISTEEEP